jgi:endoglucanase
VITRNPLNVSSTLLKNSILKAAMVLSTSLLLSACGGSSSESQPSSQPVVPVLETPAPETPVPETPVPETPAPETPAPETPVNNTTLLTIEAEDYLRFSDITPGNEGNAFRSDDVDIEALTDESGYTVGWTESGEWLEYDVTLTPGKYIISTSVASDLGGASYSIRFNGQEQGTDSVSNTGGWQVFEPHNVALIEVVEGTYPLRIDITSGGFNIDSITFSPDNGSFVPPTPPIAELPLELPDVELVVDENPISPQTAIKEMGIGINLGNTLDAPTEGAWAPKVEEKVIIDFKEAGFKHVRIPVTWNNRGEKTAPYTIDTEEMDRVEEVVDWALNQDLYVILNVHHDDWLKKGGNTFTQSNKNRFDSIWLQIVERFKNKPAKLLFEILNEPVDLSSANVDQLNTRVLEIIRRVNPTRLVVFSGNGFTPLNALLSAAIPDSDDEYLIGNFHAYDPWPFAGQCLRGWGTESDKDELENIYKQAQTWSIENNIPVTVNEFGAAKFDFTAPENVCELDERLQYLESHVEFATEYGISATFWDDAGSFSTYDRATGEWGPEKDILVAPNLP